MSLMMIISLIIDLKYIKKREQFDQYHVVSLSL